MKPVKLENRLAVNIRLNCISESEFKEFLLKEVFKLYLKNGQNKPGAADAATVVNELYRNLIRIWPGIKTNWIRDAFENGINGEYGDFANISYRLMVDWINKYKYEMKAEDFATPEEPMNCEQRSGFVLGNLDKMPNAKKFIGNMKTNTKKAKHNKSSNQNNN